MDIEDIKIGETYNVRMKFADIDADGNYCFNMETKKHIYRLFNKADVEICVFPMPDPANGTKNTAPAPKYDPCRLFKKGDKVRLQKWQHRDCAFACKDLMEAYAEGRIFEVQFDEREHCMVALRDPENPEHPWHIPAPYLELVTPVEELEPYYLQEGERSTGWGVWKRNKEGNAFSLMASFSSAHPYSKQAAKAECDRLNAEYRKEMKK